MVGISPTVISHVLNMDEKYPAVQQKRRLLDKERARALKEEVERLKENKFIREAYYPTWDFSLNAGATYQHLVNDLFRDLIGKDMEFNLEKINELREMKSLTRTKDVQSLTGWIAALNRFMAKSTDKSVPFFNSLRGSKKFDWKKECEQAFQAIKKHFSQPQVLSKPVDGEDLFIYLVVTKHAVSAALIRGENKVYHLVYYVNKRLIGAELRYLLIKKLAYCLVLISRKLRPYFQAHPIKVLTDQPLRQVLQKPETSGQLLKWAVELGQFKIKSQPRSTIKGQALANFIAECIRIPDVPDQTENVAWFGFNASNNEAEYKALLVGLRFARDVHARSVEVISVSQLVVYQILGEYSARGLRMVAYLNKAKDLLAQFEEYTIKVVPREQNSNANAVEKLASAKDADTLNIVPVEYSENPSIIEQEAMPITIANTWMAPIITYLEHGTLPDNRNDAKKMMRQAARHDITKSFSSVAHPQENGKVEAVNKMLKYTLKK
ncbi:uncharacterized protein LOC133785589 [Humulus lupulus]|uniref:uncharacterized protein LOC133785589 n=1 Tax=Humulus lupulus TaxID=3486 RepID=UPI002B402570|nr:uncharacterized protein LOC133785589 [Humulus lupulus]